MLPANPSHAFTDLVEERGGAVEMSRTGSDNVTIKAAGSGAELAGLVDGRYISLARAREAFGDEPPSPRPAAGSGSASETARERIECPWAVK